MMGCYRFFGLTVDLPAPLFGIQPHGAAGVADVRVEFIGKTSAGGIDADETPWHEAPNPYGSQPPFTIWRRSRDGRFRIRYADGVEFTVDAAGTSVQMTWPRPHTLEDAGTYLMGAVMGMVLRLRGIVCLHASAVAIHGKAVAFMAPAGIGKSTLAAVFAANGWPVITDDILAVDVTHGGGFARPSYPMLRLWPSSVERLFGSADALPRLSPRHPTWDKCYLNDTHNGFRFTSEPIPVGAIYMGSTAETGAAPTFARLSRQEALIALLANSYAAYILSGDGRAREFRSLSSAAGRIPVVAIRASDRDGIALPALYRLILDDVNRRTTAGAGD